VIAVAFIGGCGGPTIEESATLEEQTMPENDARSILANNAFFYYADLDAAWRFYGETLGFETVADYGFAKIVRIAETSYLTLVDASAGSKSADQPKTVALALVTDQLDGWWSYLNAQQVTMRSTSYSPKEGSPHDGFVAVDPEGYYLEFERFNHHPENDALMPILDALQPLYPAPDASTSRPADLGIKATVLWLYTPDVRAMSRFYEDVMGFPVTVDQGWALIHTTSPSGFIGPVDGAKGMHSWTEEKAVMVSFFTTDLQAWYTHLQAHPSFKLRDEGIVEERRAGAMVFVGADPDNYLVEFDQFLETEDNEALLLSLAKSE
jgi:catechol 2,3-dioxygenase-like lactoylglutathione lyase family enzyme